MPPKDILAKPGKSRATKLYTINSRSVKGEPGTGYEDPGDMGEFECENCEYFRDTDDSCGQKDMRRVSKRPRTRDGRVKVDPHGCCDYLHRTGKDKE